MTVIDYAWFSPTIAQLKAAGVVGVIRYVGPPSWGKTIQQAEFDALVAAGISVTLVFEIGSNDGAGGFPAGVANARLALANVPNGYTGVIYMAVDTGVSGSDLDTAVAYIAGASSVLTPSRTGDYGEGALCERTDAAGTAKWHWQSESTAFPENDHLLPMTNLWQKVDGSPFGDQADFNEVITPDYGQHPSPGPIPTPTNKDDDMYAFVVQPPAPGQPPTKDNEVVIPCPPFRKGLVVLACDFAPQQLRIMIGGPTKGWRHAPTSDPDGEVGIPVGRSSSVSIEFEGDDEIVSIRHRGGNGNDNHPVTALVIPS